jgi:hypothetical protein
VAATVDMRIAGPASIVASCTGFLPGSPLGGKLWVESPSRLGLESW